jgi:HTH-type transcriptional regulator/antitoxin HigA
MSANSHHQKSPRAPVIDGDYLNLIQQFPLMPIKNDRHLRQAHEVIDRLAIIDEKKLTQGQANYLYALSELVWVYEQKHHSIQSPDLDGVDLLKYLLEQNDMSASDLGRLLGNRQLGAAILRRERQLSKAHLLKLCARFNVSAELFLKTRPSGRRKAS